MVFHEEESLRSLSARHTLFWCTRNEMVQVVINDCVYGNQIKNSLRRISGFFCTLSLIIRIFTIVFNVLQHYCTNQLSPDSWSSLLMSSLSENDCLFVLWSSWKRRFWVIYLCLASCFSVGTCKDIECLEVSFKMNVYIFFDGLSECTCSSVVFSKRWRHQQAPALRTALFIILTL